MQYFEIDFNKLIKIGLLGKEHLVPPRLHKERRINDYVLYMVTDGVLKLKNNSELLELHPGDVYIFNKGDYQKPLCSTECKYYYLHFDADCTIHNANDEDFIEKIKQKHISFMRSSVYGFDRYNYFKAFVLQKMHLEPNSFKMIADKFDNNELSAEQNIFEKRLEISRNIEDVFILLEKICEGGYNINLKNMRVYNTVKEIADYINKNYSKQIGCNEIEKQFAINYDYANRIFKRIMGESIVKYRNNHRIERAKYLLLNTQKNLEEISSEVGFADKYYFCRCFAKIEGISPIVFKNIKVNYAL